MTSHFAHSVLILTVVGASIAACAARSTSDDAAVDERASETQEAFVIQKPYLNLKTPNGATPPNVASFLGPNNQAAQLETLTYYQHWGAEQQLTQFIHDWGFDATNANVAGAIYYNAGDLGIGRLMRCILRSSDGARACYVENYGTFGGDPTTAVNAAANRSNSFATVAMTYVPSLGSNAVNFAVYDKNGTLQNFAQLDTVGENQAVPFNCLNCHGGSYDLTNHQVLGAKFLPFDLDSFQYAAFPGYSETDQAEQFRQLNAHVYAIAQAQSSSTMIELIDGWYGGSGKVNTPTSLPFQGSVFVPSGWQNQSDFYSQVFKKYCRSCHIASSVPLADSTALTAGLPSNSQVVQNLCRTFAMPIAEVPTVAFWKDFNAQLKVLDATSQVCNTPPGFLAPRPTPSPGHPIPE